MGNAAGVCRCGVRQGCQSGVMASCWRRLVNIHDFAAAALVARINMRGFKVNCSHRAVLCCAILARIGVPDRA